MNSGAFVVAFFLYALTAESHHYFVGTSSLTYLGDDILNAYKATYNKTLGPYEPLGSGFVITSLLNGKYTVIASDVPFNTTENALADANVGPVGKRGKVTIPIALSTFTFATSKAPGVKLSPYKIASIYTGKITAWSVALPKASGKFVPVARADGSGATALVNNWLANNAGFWTYRGTATWKGQPGISSKVQFVNGSEAVVDALWANPNAFGYVVTNLAVANSLYQIAIKNPDGKYVLASNADPYVSVPKSLPAATANWAQVSLLSARGAKSYPLASFVYVFARYGGGCGHCDIVKPLLNFTQSAAVQTNIIKKKYAKQFFSLPAWIIAKNIAAIGTVSDK